MIDIEYLALLKNVSKRLWLWKFSIVQSKFSIKIISDSNQFYFVWLHFLLILFGLKIVLDNFIDSFIDDFVDIFMGILVQIFLHIRIYISLHLLIYIFPHYFIQFVIDVLSIFLNILYNIFTIFLIVLFFILFIVFFIIIFFVIFFITILCHEFIVSGFVRWISQLLWCLEYSLEKLWMRISCFRKLENNIEFRKRWYVINFVIRRIEWVEYSSCHNLDFLLWSAKWKMSMIRGIRDPAYWNDYINTCLTHWLMNFGVEYLFYNKMQFFVDEK